MAPLTDALRATLLKTGRFSIIARGDMARVLQEQEVVISTACDTTDCAVEYGQLLSVEKIVVGSIGKVGNTYQVAVKLIAVRTGKIEGIGTTQGEGGEEALFKLVDLAARDLVAAR
jgi:hypothetical protein